MAKENDAYAICTAQKKKSGMGHDAWKRCVDKIKKEESIMKFSERVTSLLEKRGKKIREEDPDKTTLKQQRTQQKGVDAEDEEEAETGQAVEAKRLAVEAIKNLRKPKVTTEEEEEGAEEKYKKGPKIDPKKPLEMGKIPANPHVVKRKDEDDKEPTRDELAAAAKERRRGEKSGEDEVDVAMGRPKPSVGVAALKKGIQAAGEKAKNRPDPDDDDSQDENIDDPREPAGYERGGEKAKEGGKAMSKPPGERTPEEQAEYERLRKKYQQARSDTFGESPPK